LHVSRSPKDPKSLQLFQDFNDTAHQMKIPFDFVRRKINLSSQQVLWEHQHFSKKRLFAATLSRFPSPSSSNEGDTSSYSTSSLYSSLLRSNILDTSERINFTLLERNIKFIAESLAKHLFNLHQDIEVFESSNAANSAFIQSYLRSISSFPRSPAHSPASFPLPQLLEKVLKEYTKDVQEQHVKVTIGDESEEGAIPYKFLGVWKSKMSAQKVKPFFFDVFLSAFIGVFLLLLHIYFKGVVVLIDTFEKVKNSLFFGNKDKKHK